MAQARAKPRHKPLEGRMPHLRGSTRVVSRLSDFANGAVGLASGFTLSVPSCA
jgi:hypothetical protein